jgi:hypothetical protein
LCYIRNLGDTSGNDSLSLIDCVISDVDISHSRVLLLEHNTNFKVNLSLISKRAEHVTIIRMQSVLAERIIIAPKLKYLKIILHDREILTLKHLNIEDLIIDGKFLHYPSFELCDSIKNLAINEQLINNTIVFPINLEFLELNRVKYDNPALPISLMKLHIYESTIIDMEFEYTFEELLLISCLSDLTVNVSGISVVKLVGLEPKLETIPDTNSVMISESPIILMSMDYFKLYCIGLSINGLNYRTFRTENFDLIESMGGEYFEFFMSLPYTIENINDNNVLNKFVEYGHKDIKFKNGNKIIELSKFKELNVVATRIIALNEMFNFIT